MANASKVSSKNYLLLDSGNHYVGGGLILQVRGGSRLWLYRYQTKGKRHVVSIGDATQITLARAKVIAGEFTARRARGESLTSTPTVPTFAEFFPEALATIQGVKRWANAKHAAQWKNTIVTYAYPVLGDKSLADITREDILAVLSPIWTTKTETATRVRGRLQEVLGLAVAKGYMTANPATWQQNLSLFLPAPSSVREVKHHEALSVPELSHAMGKFNTSNAISSLAIVFGALTCTRVQEFVGATWEEIDMETATWTIPAERMKMRSAHRVPLSRQALSVLSRLTHRDGLLFPKDGKPLAIDTPRARLRAVTRTTATMHGCRSTFRDWCAENLIHDALAERALAHVVGGKVVQAYLRSDLLEQRRPVMQQWADVLLPKG